MLTIIVGSVESFDDEKGEFTQQGGFTLELEHSLASLSKWESKHEKPFLGKGEKTDDEIVSYIQIMCLTPDVSPEVFSRLSEENYEAVNEYINSRQTATWFNEPSPKPSREIITAELIYYWMVVAQIPFECQYWHLNRLFTLIKIHGVKNSKPTKMSPSERAARNRQLNAERKRQLGTSG